MKAKRKLFINDRVQASIYLFFIMSVSILLVFAGIELLKWLPSLSVPQREYLETLKYPTFFKIMVIIIWGGFSIVSAYLFLSYKYNGFIGRFSPGCGSLARDNG